MDFREFPTSVTDISGEVRNFGREGELPWFQWDREGVLGAIGTETLPSVFSALQSQLGLKLEPKKVPVEVMVIDHMEKTPTAN